jgi:TonB-linked SusC/RagA family outer membrane protein
MNKLEHWLFLMKITIVQIVISAFSIAMTYAIDSHGQGLLDRKISIDVKGAALNDVLSLISQQANVRFAYSPELLNEKDEVSAIFKKEKLGKVLTGLLGRNFSYEVVGTYIVLAPAREIPQAAITGQVVEATQMQVSGKVTDEKGEPIPGVNIVIKGTATGTTTDVDGNYNLKTDGPDAILVFSFIGYVAQEVPIDSRTVINIVLKEDIQTLSEVVVVGYGEQKKESVVGSIGTADSETLVRRAGVTNLGGALSGQIPGVTVMERTGEPGREDPLIMIRGQSTWNEASPLILVDGIERSFNDINVHEVQSVSVLKDASATAVFGVKGANGVILITTKRGQEGKAQFSMSANYGLKQPSSSFGVVEAVTAKLWKNEGIEHEVSAFESTWDDYLPYDEVMKYKIPQQYPDLYPNVNWPDVMLKRFATNKQINVNVSGGSKATKYFASMSYLNEGDLLKSRSTNKGYDPEYAYNRLNFRGNLDFDLTKTTRLSTNISGYAGMKKETQAFSNRWIFQSLYELPPDAFPVKYADGFYGKDPSDINVHNPVAILNEAGVKRTSRLFIGTDFKLDQKLDVITKGLSAQATFSFDNYFGYDGPNIRDSGNQGQTLYKFVSPDILDAETHQDTVNATVWIPSTGGNPVNEYDFVVVPWSVTPSDVDEGALRRTLFYQLSLNYARTFGKHDVSALALFNRRQTALGASFPEYREDWVGRTTYGFNDTYFAEINAAYNGSEKFGPGYRFGFFPSFAAGWMISNEHFMQSLHWLSKLKVRASWGKVGSDAGIPRWAYIGSWSTTHSPSGTYALFGNTAGQIDPKTAMRSPYNFYWEGTIPNPDLSWETAVKKNLGVEIGLFENKLTVEADFFKGHRQDIFLSASRRNVPVYFGADPVPVNYGETETKGLEIDAMYRGEFGNGFTYWVRQSLTRAKDVVLKAEDPALQDAYLKDVGFQINQTKTQVRDGSIAASWDDVYAQTTIDNPINKLPGDWGIIDYNGDGIINSFDNIPYGYPDNRPGNTYSTWVGFGYKNFSIMVQFYGVTNITQNFSLATPELTRRTRVNEYLLDYWTPENPDAFFMAPRLGTNSPWGDLTRFDGSFLRLKTAEIAYSLPESLVSRLGLTELRFYVNGNNLLFWSDLPMDMESGGYDVQNSYPTYKVFNMGIDVKF